MAKITVPVLKSSLETLNSIWSKQQIKQHSVEIIRRKKQTLLTLFFGIFSINSPNWFNSPPPPPIHTIVDLRNNKRCDCLTNARVNSSRSETSSLPRGEGGKILVTTGGEKLTEKIRFLRWRRSVCFSLSRSLSPAIFWLYETKTIQNFVVVFFGWTKWNVCAIPIGNAGF